MNNFDLKKYLSEGRLLKENTVNNKYVVKDEEDSDDEYDFYFIDKQKALDYLSQFNNEEIDAEQFIDDDEGWGEFISSLVDVEQMTDKELEDAMRQEMSFYYYSANDFVNEGKLLKEDMSLTMDELEKLANLKSDEFKSSPKKLVDMVMGSVKFNLEKDGTNIENASEDEIDKLRYKWARLKGLLKVKDTFTSMYGKSGVKTNTDKDLLDKIKNKK